MKKIKVTVLLVSILTSFNVFSETYVCSQELRNFGRPGEIETLIFMRNGNYFSKEYEGEVDVDIYEITLETESLIILTDVFLENSLDVVFLNKKTKEFGRRFITFEDFKNPHNPNYGKCVVVN